MKFFSTAYFGKYTRTFLQNIFFIWTKWPTFIRLPAWVKWSFCSLTALFIWWNRHMPDRWSPIVHQNPRLFSLTHFFFFSISVEFCRFCLYDGKGGFLCQMLCCSRSTFLQMGGNYVAHFWPHPAPCSTDKKKKKSTVHTSEWLFLTVSFQYNLNQSLARRVCENWCRPLITLADVCFFIIYCEVITLFGEFVELHTQKTSKQKKNNFIMQFLNLH